ncbi:hypothetical protein GB937_002287 [Aspergillus fischeri]|nr:hypothetical protein GB937_002287 [Aspergillus fischeri]
MLATRGKAHIWPTRTDITRFWDHHAGNTLENNIKGGVWRHEETPVQVSLNSLYPPTPLFNADELNNLFANAAHTRRQANSANMEDASGRSEQLSIARASQQRGNRAP